MVLSAIVAHPIPASTMTDLSISSEARKTLRLGIPIIGVQIASVALGFLDTTMAGRISPADLGAIAIGRSLYMPLFIVALGIMLAVTPLVAQLLGARRRDRIGSVVRQGFWLSQFVAIPGMILVRNAEGLLPLMKVAPEVIPITGAYLDALSWGLPAALLYLVLRFFNEGVLESKPGMYFAFLAVPLNFVANYILMFGKFGFPALGAVGAGYATSLVWWIIMIGLLIYTVRRSDYRRFAIFDRFEAPSWASMRELVGIGLPNGVSLGMEVTMFAGAALIVGGMGVEPLAAHQVAINFASIVFMIPLGLSIATSSRVGYALGGGSREQARLVGVSSMLLCLGLMVVSMAVMILFPEPIVRIYTSDAAVLAIAAPLIVMAGIFQLSDGLQAAAAASLRGLKDTRVPMLVNLVAYWMVGLPTGFWLGVRSDMGPKGIWMGLIAGLTVAAIIHPLRFFWLIRRVDVPVAESDREGEVPA